MPELYIITSRRLEDLRGAIGTIDKQPGWTTTTFSSGNLHVQLLEGDFRKLDFNNDRVRV